MDEASRDPFRLSPGQLRALYAAVVVGLLTFALVALLFPAPIHSYRARAVVEQTALVGKQAPLELALLTLPEVQQHAEDSFRTLAASKQATANFADSVACEVERPTPQQVQIKIEISDRYADRSLALCRGIADDLVKNAEASFIPGLARLRSERADVEQRLALVRQSKRVAEDELTLLTREHVSRVTSAVQGTVSAAQAANLAGSEKERLTALWRQLNAERGELSRTKTEQHPQVREIDLRLAELKQHLDSLAKAETPARQAPLEGLQEEFRRRSQELTEAIAEHRRREEELLAEAARLAITPAPIALSTRVVEPPEVVDRLGGQPSGFQIAVLMLLSITAGGLTYRLLRQWLAQQKFNSAEEIQDQLELPVITLAARYDAAASILSSRILRRSLLAAEASLAMVVLMAFLLVAWQPELARPITADPLGAVAEAVDRTFSPTFRR